jgi:hypothetical protein
MSARKITYLSRQHPSNTSFPIDPPEAIAESHPPQSIRTSTCWARLDGKETALCDYQYLRHVREVLSTHETPTLGRVSGLRVELWYLVDEFWIRGCAACTSKVWSVLL